VYQDHRMRRLSSRPPLPLLCRLCPIWIGCQHCPPMKGELRGRGVK
jgi:hypothetical protein